jgi:hypothetical protein
MEVSPDNSSGDVELRPEDKQVIYTGKCAHCKKPFATNSVLYAFGYPQMALLHVGCQPFFNYSTWAHGKPAQYFYDNMKRR